MRYIVTLIAFIISAPDSASAAAISGDKYNKLVDSYNVMWQQHETLVKKHNAMVKEANFIIDRRNFFAAEIIKHAAGYFKLRQEIYDDFSLGRQKLTLTHPDLYVPAVIDEKNFEKDAKSAEKEDVSTTPLKRIDGAEMVQLHRDMALQLKAMNKKFAAMQDALDGWNDDHLKVKEAWYAALVKYGSLGLAWNHVQARTDDLKLFKSLCANMACQVGDVSLVYGPRVK